MSRGNRRPGSDQQGFALLVTLLVLVIGAATLYVSARNPAEGQRAVEAHTNARALSRARAVLLARAGADDNRPGSLSCPDLDGNGSAGSGLPPSCGDRLGRFPHQTYGVNPLRDAARERVWYAIADGLLDQGTVTVNPGTVVPFEVDGRGGYAAAVMTPGDVLEGQDRSEANSNNAGQHLEKPNDAGIDNADGPPFVDCAGREGCNDGIRGVTTAELFEVPQRRVLAAVARMLQQFYNDHGYLPYAAAFGSDECEGEATGKRTVGQLPFTDEGDCGGAVFDREEDDPTDGWLNANDWFDYVVYRVDSGCAGAGATCGTGDLALGQNTGLQAVIAVAGRALDAPAHDPGQPQDRTTGPGNTPTIEDYLDSDENINGDIVFDDVSPRPDDNDSLEGVVVNE